MAAITGKVFPFQLRQVWIALALIAATVAAYWVVGSFDFVNLDDPKYITENPQVLQGLNWSGVQWAFTTNHASNWHPLTWLSHMADVEIFGVKSGAHHLVNLFFHVLNSVLLFGFLYRVTGATGRSALVAALFALHPLHVESVAWISERKDVLSTFFFMLTLGAYYSFVSKRSLGRYLVVFTSLALGLLAKPMLVTLPFLLLLLDFWPLRRTSYELPDLGQFTRLVIEKLPLFALIIVSSVITFLVQQEGGAVNSLDQVSLLHRLSNSLVSYVMYIKQMLWPAGLAAMYPMPLSIPAWQSAGALVLLSVASIAVIKSARPYPYLPVGWFWYMGTLVPVIGFVHVGVQAMADRYTYIPLIGLFIIVAWGGYDLLSRGSSKRAPLVVISVLMVLALAVATHAQLVHWANGKTLWRHALTVTKDNYRAHAAYGSLLSDEGHTQSAQKHFEEAIRIQPSYAEAHNKLGVVLAEQGKSEEAVSHYRESIRYSPEFAPAYNNLGNTLVAQGRFTDAVSYYYQALDIDPDNALTHNNLGSALDDLGRTDEAIAEYRVAIELDSESAAAYNNLAAVFTKTGRFDEALLEMSAALQFDPDNAVYHYNYSMLLNHQGDTIQARRHLETTLSLDPQHKGARSALAKLSDQSQD